MEAPQEPAVMFRMEQDNEIRKQIMSNVCDEMKSKLADKLFKIVRAGEPDCMLSVEQKVAPAHKIILSGVSQLLKVILAKLKSIFFMNFILYFQETFELDKSDKPSSIFVPDSRYEDVLSLLALTYDGKIKIHVDQLKSLQKIAKTLKVEIPAIATQAEAYLDEESCGILMFQTSSGSLACASSMTSPHSNAVLSPTSSSTTASSDGYENDRGTPKPVTKQPRKIKVKTQGEQKHFNKAYCNCIRLSFA